MLINELIIIGTNKVMKNKQIMQTQKKENGGKIQAEIYEKGEKATEDEEKIRERKPNGKKDEIKRDKYEEVDE